VSGDVVSPGRLHSIDVVWLELEGDGPPIAIGMVAVADGPPPEDDDVLAMLAARLPRMPGLRQRLARDGVGFRRPARVETEDVQLRAHVFRVPAATTASHGGLDGTVSAVMEHRLPRDGPMWDLWVVEGLDDGRPDGRWAVVWRIHHTITDGLGAIALVGHTFDVAPDGGPTMTDALLGDTPAPFQGELQGRHEDEPAGGCRLRHALEVVASAAAHVPAMLATVVPHPPSSLAAPVGERRLWCSVDVPLAEVKAARRAFGATVNDVVLAAVAGGFRDLLRQRGEPVDGRVVRNLVPVSTRPAGNARAGNQVSGLLHGLPVGVADPVARLHAVTAAVGHGKQAHAAGLAALWLGIVDRTVPSFVQDVAVASAGQWVPSLFFDTLTTNVQGPSFPVYLLGRRVRSMYPLIPVAGHTTITTGILSYDGTLNIGVTGAGEPAGDVAVLARGIRRCVAELADLARGETS